MNVTANIWEKHGKRIVYFNDKFGKSVASYDLVKREWRDSCKANFHHELEIEYAELLEMAGKTEEIIEVEAQEQKARIRDIFKGYSEGTIDEAEKVVGEIEEAKIYETFFKAFNDTFPRSDSGKRTIQGLRHRMVLWNDFEDKNGTAYGACYADYLEA